MCFLKVTEQILLQIPGTFRPFSGRHREGRREGVELLKDLHSLLKNPPPLLKKHTPPF